MKLARVAATNNHLVQTWSHPPRLKPESEQVRAQLLAWLALQPSAPKPPFRFGDLSRPTPEVNERYSINYEVVESAWYGTVDDFYAAFGKGLLKLAISGMVERVGSNWRITIDEIATFLRDTYDFNGDQPLGSWGPSGFSRAAFAAEEIEIDPAVPPSWWTRQHNYFSVNNGSFRRYRNRFGRGGDFVIFSDLRRVSLAPAVTITVRA